MQTQSLARSLLAALALIVLASIAVQFIHNRSEDRATLSALGSAWDMARYFTILTNAMIGVAALWMAIRGRWVSAALMGGLVLWILVVGIVYHVLLARDLTPGTLEWWADLGLHTVVPVAALLLWLGFAPKAPIALRHPALWVVWPMAYAGYALIRGVADGKYPYFFLDPVKQGTMGLVGYISGLGLAFYLGGLAIRWIAGRLHR